MARVIPNEGLDLILQNQQKIMQTLEDVKKELAIEKFLTGMPNKFDVATGNVKLCGAIIEVDPATGKAMTQGRMEISPLGLDAFVLFKRGQMLVFFLFAMMLGAALQITNAFGGAFLDEDLNESPHFGRAFPRQTALAAGQLDRDIADPLGLAGLEHHVLRQVVALVE